MEGRALRVLIVSFYFPPAGGGGVQRVLKLCRHLADLGVEVDVLAPDDPRFSARDPDLVTAIPAGTTVHRARYRGPSGETPASRLARTEGTARRLALHARLAGRRLLLPDPEVAWAPDAVRVGTRVIRERSIDVVLTTSPPNSAHVIGALLKRRTGVRLVADLRDSWLANPHRRYERRAVRAKRAVEQRIARRALGAADAITAVTPFIAREAETLVRPGTPVHVVPNGCDFDDFDGLAYTRGARFVVLHAGSFFGQRSPRPFLEAVAALDDPRIVARFLGELRPADRAWALGLGLGDRLELAGFRPHHETLRAMKEADVLLLLVPRADGRGLSILSGKVYEYLASERPVLALVPPEGAAAELLRETGAPGGIEGALGPLASRGAQGGIAPLGFLEAYRKAGGPQPDAVALNPYLGGLLPEYRPKEVQADGAITLRNLDQLETRLKKDYARPVDVWLTEFAWRIGRVNRLGTVTASRQATLTRATVALVRHYPFVRIFTWFLLRDEKSGVWRSGLVGPNGQPRPAFRIWKRGE